MSQHPNITLARRCWSAVSQGDTAALTELWAKDLVWHATAQGTPWWGDHAGPDSVLDFLARIGESADRFDARLDDVMVSDSRFALIMHIHAEREGRELDVDYCLVARVEVGCVAEVWTAPLDPNALRAFWAS